MKQTALCRFLLVGILVLPLAACNLSTHAPTPTPIIRYITKTPSPATATQAASPTLSPTNTSTSAPPTETQAVLVTPELVLTTSAPIIPTPTKAAVQAIKLKPGTKFSGTFEGGDLIFRIGQTGNEVVPKSINIRKADCKEGGKMSDLLAFDPPPSFAIEDGQFTISRGKQVYMTGVFLSETQARGSIEIHITEKGKNCSIGPVTWMASVQ